jgi:hypothetical protein
MHLNSNRNMQTHKDMSPERSWNYLERELWASGKIAALATAVDSFVTGSQMFCLTSLISEGLESTFC